MVDLSSQRILQKLVPNVKYIFIFANARPIIYRERVKLIRENLFERPVNIKKQKQ